MYTEESQKYTLWAINLRFYSIQSFTNTHAHQQNQKKKSKSKKGSQNPTFNFGERRTKMKIKHLFVLNQRQEASPELEQLQL